MIQLATLYKRGHIKNKESRFLTFIDCVRTRENCPQCLLTRHCSDHWLIVYFIIPIFGVSSDPKRSPRWPVKRHKPFPSFLPLPVSLRAKIPSSCTIQTPFLLLILLLLSFPSSSFSSFSPASKQARFAKKYSTYTANIV